MYPVPSNLRKIAQGNKYWRRVCHSVWGTTAENDLFPAVGLGRQKSATPLATGEPERAGKSTAFSRGPIAKRWEGSFCAQPHCREKGVKSLCAILHLRHFYGTLLHRHPSIMGYSLCDGNHGKCPADARDVDFANRTALALWQNYQLSVNVDWLAS